VGPVNTGMEDHLWAGKSSQYVKEPLRKI